MKLSIVVSMLCIVCFALLSIVQSFQSISITSNILRKTVIIKENNKQQYLKFNHIINNNNKQNNIQLYEGKSSRNDNNNNSENLRPITSFGSEAVPENQRPINEYLDVTKQPFFDWADTNTGTFGLIIRLFILYNLIFWLICYPISGATYTIDGYLIQKLLSSNIGAISCILILMLRIYTGWNYIGQRLISKTIEYEETGWYDGAYEIKTDNELKRDKLLYINDVKPVIERCKNIFYSIFFITIISFITYNISNNNKPLPFNQYDPNVLEKLSYDDKLANNAAINTYGKPAYCDSRYYQAIANGGQGCN